MAKIGDLPVELVDLITDYLCRAGDLAALARTNHRFHDAVDPILYKFAREYVPNSVSWHPLRWASQYGKTGTLNKVLAAGIDVNMAFVHVDSMSFHDWDKFRERGESAGSTPLEGSQEWEPHEDDTDTDDWATSTSTHDDRMPPEYLTSSRLARGLRFSDMADDEFAWNGFDDFDAVDEFLDGPEDNSMAGGDFMSEIDSLAEAAAVAAFQNGHVPWSDGEMDDDGDMDDDDGTGLDEDENGHEGAPRRHADRRRDPESFWALHIAARAGQDDVVEILLDHGASIDICSHQMGRPVHLLSRDCPEQHGTLLSPADIGYSPLHLAICYFQESTARLLLSRGASPRLSEPHRKDAFTALHAASAAGEVGLCKYILDGGFAELDALDHTGLTPFYYAYRSGRWDSTVSYLLEKGADIDFLIRQYDRHYANEGGEFSTTLYEACVYGYYTEAIKLINLGADVNKGVFGLDKQYRSPLHAVCEPPTQFLGPRRHPALSSTPAPVNNIEEQRVELVELMLRSGADLEAKTCPQRESPLQLAATHCDVAALQVLLAEGADVQSQNCDGRTPLFSACGPRAPGGAHFFRPAPEIVAIKMLMDYGSNLDTKDNAGDTALHLACSLRSRLHDGHDDERQERMVRTLLQRGAKGDGPNSVGVTPFETAFRGGLLGVCDVLVRHRHFPCKHEDFDRMMLELVRERPHHLSSIDLLLDLDVSGTLFSKPTYLMKMVGCGDVRMASRYLERCPARMGPLLRPKEKLTILQAGLTHNNKELVKQMLAMKVSVNSPDKNGHTPLYIALHGYLSSKEELVRDLLEAGADIYFKPQSSTIMTPLEKAISLQDHTLVFILLQHQPIRDNPRAPKGVYLHAAARAAPSKRMLSTLILSGASVTELDSNGDTPLSVFLKSIADLPHWAANTRRAGNRICGTVWYLWNNKVDINLRNKSGKAITSYLSALRMYDGDNLARKRIAEELRLGLEIVPAQGADGETELKTLRFRHGLMGLGNFHGGSKPPIGL